MFDDIGFGPWEDIQMWWHYTIPKSAVAMIAFALGIFFAEYM